MLVFHIANLDEEDLAKRMLVEQETNNWPGLLEEVNGMCVALNLENPTKTSMSKKMYSRPVHETLFVRYRREQALFDGGLPCLRRIQKNFRSNVVPSLGSGPFFIPLLWLVGRRIRHFETL